MTLAAILLATVPFLDEAQLKSHYDASSVYAIYNTHSSEVYTETQNPIAAIMGVCKHYGRLPNGAEKLVRGKVESDKDWIRALNKWTRLAGLRDDNFGKLPRWKTMLSRTMKVRDPKRDIVEVENQLTFRKEAAHLREWMDARQPVLWVREAIAGEEQDDTNRRINGGKPFPLTIALIDGIDDEGRIHVVWPRGNDRRYKEIKSGWHLPEDLFYDVNRSILIYWRP